MIYSYADRFISVTKKEETYFEGTNGYVKNKMKFICLYSTKKVYVVESGLDSFLLPPHQLLF